MEWPQDQAPPITLTMAGESFPVQSGTLIESLSTCYEATVVWSSPDAEGRRLLGRTVTLTLADQTPRTRQFVGVIVTLQTEGPDDGCYRLTATIRPQFYLAHFTTDTRIFQNSTALDIVKTICDRTNIPRTARSITVGRGLSARPYTVQWQETDLEFCERLLADEGLIYYSDAGSLVISDAGDLPTDSIAVSRLAVSLSSARNATGFQAFSPYRRAPRVAHAVYDYAPMTSTVSVKAGSTDSNHFERIFATGHSHVAAGDQKARLRSEQHEAARMGATAHGNILLAPGNAVIFEGASYRVVTITHAAHQPHAGSGHDTQRPRYEARLTLIPLAIPYRPPAKPRPKLPGVYTAHLESTGPYATLDGQGQEWMRPHFDLADKPRTETAPPFSRMTPNANPAAGDPRGLRFSALNNTELLWSAVAGDPDRPILLGTVPNPATSSPVTAENASQAQLRTASGHTLRFEDQKAAPYLLLATPAALNYLNLSANPHRATLASEEGALLFQAGRHVTQKAGMDLTARHGESRTETVKRHAASETRTGTLHKQSGRDIALKAHDEIHVIAETATFQAKKAITFTSAKGTITAEKKDIIAEASVGALTIGADKAITIASEGNGDIVIANGSGAQFRLTQAGVITVSASHNLTFDADHVRWTGQIHYEGADPASHDAAALVPLKPTPIQELLDTPPVSA